MISASEKPLFSSGIPSLDQTLGGVLAGDNVVLQVEDVRDFLPFLLPFCQRALADGKQLVYFRFAQHQHLLPPELPALVHEIDPRAGFETFISEILQRVSEHGVGACYVFDGLSDLVADWYSDRMLGNFFRITCPYLYRLDTVAYFMLMRNHHTPPATDAIHTTAQVVIDVLRSEERLHVLPIKVLGRHSPTLYMLHAWEEDGFHPVTDSATTAEILAQAPQPWTGFSAIRRDAWAETFALAERAAADARHGAGGAAILDALKKQLIKMIFTREDELCELCDRFIDIHLLVAVGKRMIGTGRIGGKSVGMLLARAILQRQDSRWQRRLEPHDSFFIGTDVFYTFVIHNDCWWDRYHLRSAADLYEHAGRIREKMLAGSFPPDIVEQFRHMLNYFGQSPIIVRSSSLLEDAYGNAFSGKYDSVFCASQGDPEDRLRIFMDAVRAVYASTMSHDALAYRAHRGLLNQDEQMALLVQRVSGALCGDHHFPHLAGVAYSWNPFVWNPAIDPAAGVLRLVFGLGTRAVDRGGEDHTRIVALNAPQLRPEPDLTEVRKYTQRFVDLLDLRENCFTTHEFEAVARATPGLPLEWVATRDEEMLARAAERGIPPPFPWILTFEPLLTQTTFAAEMREMLKTLEAAYNHPVDIEFAANFNAARDYRINLLQCRPFQVSRELNDVPLPEDVPAANVLLRSNGPVVGQGFVRELRRIVYVRPSAFGKMSMSDRHGIARLIGDLNQSAPTAGETLLVGPGRWGSKMAALGIPVCFREIRNAAAICEIVAMHEGLTPEISLGTHFFNDLVEMRIAYLAHLPGQPGHLLNEAALLAAPNRLATCVPSAARWSDAVRVVDAADLRPGHRLLLHVDACRQQALLFLDPVTP